MPLFARFLLLPCLFVLFTGALPPAFGQDGMRCSPDVNRNNAVDADDALVLYYAYSLGSVLGSGRGAGGGGRYQSLMAGDTFRECPGFPEMVVVPGGTFTMGALATEEGSRDEERPRHEVTIADRFAVGTHEVTFAEYDACHAAGGCSHGPRDRSWGRGNQPVIEVSWNDAKEYVAWLSRGTGATYRLLTEAEWEYAARAGMDTAYPWGNDIGSGNANCFGCGGDWTMANRPAPVGTFDANAFGLYDMVGNVAEWVEDCWHGSYGDEDGNVIAPANGGAWGSENDGNCNQRVIRGGSTISVTDRVRSAARAKESGRNRYRGFRVARTLD